MEDREAVVSVTFSFVPVQNDENAVQSESFPSVGGTQANGICGQAGKASQKFQPKETTQSLISVWIYV